MIPQQLPKLPRFYTIGTEETINVIDSMQRGLSGYLGGVDRAGYWVERLSETWKDVFHGCLYVTPCNSATSGLLVACMAAEVGPGDTVWVPTYTMSATAACAKVLGAKVRFVDIEEEFLGINPMGLLAVKDRPKAVIVVNLLGHPAQLASIRGWCDANDVVMIEDNAQAPLAQEHNQYTGTIGHIGVFSLNVHKHIQCGEGGVITTGVADLGARIKALINHAELHPGFEGKLAGLNLRMTEPVAAIAVAQVRRAKALVAGRVAIAQQLTEMVRDFPFLIPPQVRTRCIHSYYVWAPQMKDGYSRDRFVMLLSSLGFPIRPGYSTPLHRIFPSDDLCPTADKVEDRIMSYEVCAYDPSDYHLKHMRDILHWAAEQVTSMNTEVLYLTK